jgi:hypothetical protein
LLAHRRGPLGEGLHDPERSRHRGEPWFVGKLRSAFGDEPFALLCAIAVYRYRAGSTMAADADCSRCPSVNFV